VADFASGVTFILDSTNPKLSDIKINEEIYILNYVE
jgi:hypothetical protein